MANSMHSLVPRQTTITQSCSDADQDPGQILLCIISNPFASQVNRNALYSSLIVSIVGTILIAAVFCLIRPYNTVVYAPRAKYADRKHAPPPVGRGLFSWIGPVFKTDERNLIDTVGLDAALFIRFSKMCRNILLCLTLLGCGIIIPVNVVAGSQTRNAFASSITWYNAITPQYANGGNLYWAFVVCAYLFDLVICYFLWINYKAVVRMRRGYFDSDEYQRSLHSRTLLLTDIPRSLRSDDGILNITREIPGDQYPVQPAIARDVRQLTELVATHEKTVRQLESVFAKYLKKPENLPKRPTCKADTGPNKGQDVDAIDHLTTRIKDLESSITTARLSVGNRNAMSYGFATYSEILHAHDRAYRARKKGPSKAIVRLAAKPTDLIWRNLGLSSSERRRKNLVSNLWVGLLTLIWIAPNAFIAALLANLSNLALLWPAFKTNFERNPVWWGVVQGVLAPALTTLFYLYLPAIFRKLCVRAGDLTKTSRERHVLHKLFSFFLVNNLIVFSLFTAIWVFISTVINGDRSNNNIWEKITDAHPLQQIIRGLNQVTPYWTVWLLQRNLGAAVDLAQLFTLTWGSFSRRFLSPTPRELIELSAPQPFDYAGYYNYFLFYSTVAIVFATLQPLVLPVAAVYFCIDTYFKKYLILYIFISKVESGGAFWTVLYNRFLWIAVLGNVIIALLVVAQGDGRNYGMLASLAPLPFLLFAFKWYCKRAFDDQLQYYSKGKIGDGEKSHGTHGSKGVRSGNPVLYKPLMTPMVLAKAQHLLKDIYHGRTSEDDASVAGYSDIYMNDMDKKRPGKSNATPAPYELVQESELDFEHFKSRPEFADAYGGGGELFGRAQDMSRPGTPGSQMTALRQDSPTRSEMGDFRGGRVQSPQMTSPRSNASAAGGDVYRTGRTQSPLAGDGTYEAYRSPQLTQSPNMSPDAYNRSQVWTQRERQNSPTRAGLLQDVQSMGQSPPMSSTAPARRPVARPSPRGYGPVGTPTHDAPHDTSYDYFRH